MTEPGRRQAEAAPRSGFTFYVAVVLPVLAMLLALGKLAGAGASHLERGPAGETIDQRMQSSPVELDAALAHMATDRRRRLSARAL